MLQAFDVSAAVFVRGLTNLKTLLTKGEAHGTKVTASAPELLLHLTLAYAILRKEGVPLISYRSSAKPSSTT